jgi:hypothetical protein
MESFPARHSPTSRFKSLPRSEEAILLVRTYASRERDFVQKQSCGDSLAVRQALRAIRMEMDRQQFWPAIYHVNNHGNVALLSHTGREIAAWV